MKKTYVPWKTIHQSVRDIAEQVQSEDWKGIVGVARGGLVPAVMLSHRLSIPTLKTFTATSYKGMDKADLSFDSEFTLDNEGEGWLFVEDIIDSGDTANLILDRFPKACLATVFCKVLNVRRIFHTDRVYYSVDLTVDDWLVFPWECTL